MKTRFQLPADAPEHCCGRCYWWHQKNADGDGKCITYGEPSYYKCMVCAEYEMNINLY